MTSIDFIVLKRGRLLFLLSNSSGFSMDIAVIAKCIVGFGFKNLLPEKINNQIDYAITETKNNDGLNLNLALAYSSRYEILKASERIAKDLTNKKITSDDLNEKKMNEYMLTSKVPDPDLLIRTGGTHRLSNFLLWQCAYTELYFTNKFWPDFNQDDLVSAIIDYQSRERKFGTIKS